MSPTSLNFQFYQKIASKQGHLFERTQSACLPKSCDQIELSQSISSIYQTQSARCSESHRKSLFQQDRCPGGREREQREDKTFVSAGRAGREWWVGPGAVRAWQTAGEQGYQLTRNWKRIKFDPKGHKRQRSKPWGKLGADGSRYLKRPRTLKWQGSYQPWGGVTLHGA